MKPRRAMTITLVVVLAVLALSAKPAFAATASCYGPGLFGNPMASGAILNEGTIALAHRSLDVGTKHRIGARLMVKAGNGRARMMLVRDRGPFVHGRTLDITHAGVRKLGVSSCHAWGVRSVRTWRYPYRRAAR